MTFVGIVLLCVGAVAAGMMFTGAAPEALMTLGMPIWGWGIVAVIGLLLIVFNRRPSD